MTFTIDLRHLHQQAGLQGHTGSEAPAGAPPAPSPPPRQHAAPTSPANAAKRLTPRPMVSHLAGLAGVASNDEGRPEGQPDGTSVARLARLARLGCSEERAHAAADQLAQRDEGGDDRRMCVECSHLGDSGRCVAAATGRLRNVDRRYEPVPDLLQRCEAFGLRKGLL